MAPCLENLPNEILELIADCLDVKDLGAFRLASRSTNIGSSDTFKAYYRVVSTYPSQLSSLAHLHFIADKNATLANEVHTMQLLVSHFAGNETTQLIGKLVGKPSKEWDNMRYLANQTAERRQQNLEDLKKAVRKFPNLKHVTVAPFPLSFSDRCSALDLGAHLNPTDLRAASCVEKRTVYDESGLKRRGKSKKRYLPKTSPIVASHNASLRLTFDMMMAVLIENRATLQVEFLDVQMRYRYGPFISHCDFWHSLPEQHPEILKETFKNLRKFNLEVNVPEASVAKDPCENEFFCQILLDASPGLEVLNLSLSKIDGMLLDFDDRCTTNLFNTLRLPRLERLRLEDASIRELSPFIDFLRRHSNFFQLLAEEMTVKHTLLAGLFQSYYQRHAPRGLFEVSEKKDRIEGMKKLLIDNAKDLLDDEYTYL